MTRRTPVALLLLLLALAAAHLLLYRGWIVDDAWITWRYAENIHQGLGPVYNAGERVEGFSNPAWVLLGAAALRAGTSPAVAAIAFALLAAFAVLPGAYALVRRERPAARWAPLVPVLILAFTPAYVSHPGNGLETGAFAAAVFALAVLAADPVRGAGRGAVLAVAALATAWLRPEGVAYVLGAAAYQGWRLRREAAGAGRAAGVAWGATGLLLAASLVLRWSYYGSLVPNTYHAKLTGTAGGLIDGAQYLADFLREGVTLLTPTLAAVPLVLGRLGVRGRAMAGAALLAAVFAVGAGGDWMLHYRFLAPAVPPLAVLAGLGVADLGDLARRAGRGRAVARALAALGIAAAAGVADAELAVWRQVAPARAAGHERGMVYAEVGRWLREHTPPGALVAASDIGAVGAESDRPILDMFGLVDAHVARRPGKQHHKTDPDYVLSRRPAAVVLIRDALDPERFGRRPDAALWHREAFRSGYRLVREFPLPADAEVVSVYLRRDEGLNRGDADGG